MNAFTQSKQSNSDFRKILNSLPYDELVNLDEIYYDFEEFDYELTIFEYIRCCGKYRYYEVGDFNLIWEVVCEAKDRAEVKRVKKELVKMYKYADNDMHIVIQLLHNNM